MNTLRWIGSCAMVVLLAGAVWMLGGCGAHMRAPYQTMDEFKDERAYQHRPVRPAAPAAAEVGDRERLAATVASPGEELWIISRSKVAPEQALGARAASQPGMLASTCRGLAATGRIKTRLGRTIAKMRPSLA